MRTGNCFLCWLDENDGQRAGFVKIIDSSDPLTLTFETEKNRITIPKSRILKIKEPISTSGGSPK